MAERKVRWRVSQEHARRSGRQRAEDEQEPDQAEAQKSTEAQKSAEEVSAIADDVLEEIDRALKSACGFDADESVSDEELEVRANAVVTSFQQKGGQ